MNNPNCPMCGKEPCYAHAQVYQCPSHKDCYEKHPAKMTFEDFLMEKHLEEYTGIKDDHQEAFDDWLGQLDSEEYLAYGNEYVSKLTQTS